MSTIYVSGPYTSGQLLRNIRAVEDAITRHFIERGPITAPGEQRSMADRLLDVSQGRNTVMFDDVGNPSIMVRFPAYTLDVIGMGDRRTPHPAFIVNGGSIPEVWISKYLAGRGENDRPVSLRGVGPWVNITFDAARAACFAKGPGWHLMTNAEWAAVALWCLKNGFQPRGNDNYGASHAAPWERGVYAPGRTDRTLTGSGPASWYHDGTPTGIADLRGNVWEWVDGLKLVNGRIYVHHDNDFDTGNSKGSVDGWVDTERYFDNSVPGDDQATDHPVGGSIVLNTTRENPMYTGGDTNSNYGYNSKAFKSTAAKQGVSVPDLLRYLAIMPPDDVSDIASDTIYVRNYGERLARRGGYWTYGADAGLFCLSLGYQRSASTTNGGFRAAFVS